METRANYLAIGIFTLLVFAMAFGFVYWLVRFNETGEAKELTLVIPGSASGLTRGSGVFFNGLRVGSVLSVEIRPDDPGSVYAKLNIADTTPLREDTAVSIASQPLTGLATVSLIGGSPEKPLFLEQDELPPLRARPSALQDTIEQASVLVATANTFLTKVDGLVDSNTEAINATVANVEAFSAALANNADGIDELLKNVAETSSAINALGATLTAVSDDVEAIVEAIDPEVVGRTLVNVEVITANLAENSDEIDAIISEARSTVENFNQVSVRLNETAQVFDPENLRNTLANVETFTGSLNETLGKVDNVVGALDADRVNAILASVETFTSRLDQSGDEIDAIIKNAKTATDDVAAFTGSLSSNRENIDKIVANAAVVSERLIATSETITKLIGRVDGLVEADGGGFITEATDAARAIRQIADSFQARADRIAGGLERFSTRGLGDIEALIAQSRQAVDRIDGVVRDLESNPTQFLLGGNNRVPEYRPRR